MQSKIDFTRLTVRELRKYFPKIYNIYQKECITVPPDNEPISYLYGSIGLNFRKSSLGADFWLHLCTKEFKRAISSLYPYKRSFFELEIQRYLNRNLIENLNPLKLKI